MVQPLSEEESAGLLASDVVARVATIDAHRAPPGWVFHDREDLMPEIGLKVFAIMGATRREAARPEG
jgi:hypothetical protein